jgi:hypothetical protein
MHDRVVIFYGIHDATPWRGIGLHGVASAATMENGWVSPSSPSSSSSSSSSRARSWSSLSSMVALNVDLIMGGRIATAWHRLPRRGIFHGVASAAWIPGYRGVTMTSLLIFRL